jgi:hypothetical protein
MHRHKTGLAHGALRLANRLARPLDKLASSSAPGSTAPIMVVGLPRSGTTLVYELLVQAFEVGFLTRLFSYTYGLPNFSARLVAQKIRDPLARFDSTYGKIPGRFAPAENAVFWERWFAETEELGHHIPSGCISDRATHEAEAIIASMSAITRRPFVFKNVYMTLSVPAFLRLLPRAKVVVVQRNFESVVASLYKGRKTRATWWSIHPPFATDVYSRDAFEQTVFQCVRSQQILERTLASMAPSQCLIVDYESVCEAPQSFVEKVAVWAGTDFARRSNSMIPDRFKASKGPGIPKTLASNYASLTDSLNETGEKYWSRIRSFVAERNLDARN